MARDWLKAFRPAAYRGVPFKVDVESAAGARRLSISPIAYAEGVVIEDMGRQPGIYEITAYVAGDLADAAAMALTAALGRRGAGLLVLPMLPPLSARCSQWRLAREKDRAGHVAFDIVFIEAGLNAMPTGGAPTAGGLAALIDRGADILANVFG